MPSKTATFEFMPSKTATFEETFLQAVALAYRLDETGAGITCAWLRDKKVWYASLIRYPHGSDGIKVIAARAYSCFSQAHCICILAASWAKKKDAPQLALKLAAFQCVKSAIAAVEEA